jgi:hypothetical protein
MEEPLFDAMRDAELEYSEDAENDPRPLKRARLLILADKKNINVKKSWSREKIAAAIMENLSETNQ